MFDSFIETLFVVGGGFLVVFLVYVWNLYSTNKNQNKEILLLEKDLAVAYTKELVLKEEINKLTELTCPVIKITVHPNTQGLDDIVNINIDWPKDYDEDKVFDVYSKLLYLIQSGHLYPTFDKALRDKCKQVTCDGLVEEINLEIQNYIDNDRYNISNSGPVDGDLVMYPSQVFQGGNERGN